jgi:hypothetical protein
VLEKQGQRRAADRGGGAGHPGRETGTDQAGPVDRHHHRPGGHQHAEQDHDPDGDPERALGEHAEQPDAGNSSGQPRTHRPGEPGPVDVVVLAHQRHQRHQHRQPQQQVRHQPGLEQHGHRRGYEPEAQADESLHGRTDDEGGGQDGHHPRVDLAQLQRAQPFSRLRRTYCRMPPCR